MSSHHTYIPWFHEKKDPKEGLAEAKEKLKTQRLCVQCNEFKQFVLRERLDLWLIFACPDCGELIKIQRNRNYTKRKWD